jgi:hypothetical protein
MMFGDGERVDLERVGGIVSSLGRTCVTVRTPKAVPFGRNGLAAAI